MSFSHLDMIIHPNIRYHLKFRNIFLVISQNIRTLLIYKNSFPRLPKRRIKRGEIGDEREKREIANCKIAVIFEIILIIKQFYTQATDKNRQLPNQHISSLTKQNKKMKNFLKYFYYFFAVFNFVLQIA